MAIDKLKNLWKDSKFAIYNRKDRNTFEALQLLHNKCSFTFYDITIDIYKYESFQELHNFDLLYNNNLKQVDFNLSFEPTEILKIFNQK